MVDVLVSGQCDPHLGWLMDYGDLSRRFAPLHRQLDHFYLDDIEGMNDTSPAGIRQWILDRFALDVPAKADVQVRIVGECVYRLQLLDADGAYGLPPRFRFGFEAAHFLPNLPETHKCRRLHGHSFVLEVGAKDVVRLGEQLRDVYHALDHTCLNDLAGLRNPTSEHVAQWIWTRLQPKAPDLAIVVIAETCTARCLYRGE